MGLCCFERLSGPLHWFVLLSVGLCRMALLWVDLQKGCKVMQRQALESNAKRCKAMQNGKMMQYQVMQHYAKQCKAQINAKQCKARQDNATQSTVMQCKAVVQSRAMQSSANKGNVKWCTALTSNQIANWCRAGLI